MSSLCQTRSSQCVFLFIRPITYTRASGSAMPEPQQRRQWEGANVWQKNPSPQTLRSPKIGERLVVTARSTARSCQSMSLTCECSPADRNRPIFFRSNLCRFRSKFAWALSLGLSSPWTMIFFLRSDKYGQEVKISSKCPTSAIASPHVKYVKGC